jgi:hypothetical protein
MEINVNHPIKMTRLAVKALVGADEKGVVCLVASGAGLSGFYPTALYCASKAAAVGFAKSMGLCLHLSWVSPFFTSHRWLDLWSNLPRCHPGSLSAGLVVHASLIG